MNKTKYYRVKFDIVGATPLVFNKYLPSNGNPRQPSVQYLEENFYLKAHTDKKGIMQIPGPAIRNCICGSFLNNRKYEKMVRNGLMCVKDFVSLGVRAKKAKKMTLVLVTNSGTPHRIAVKRNYPMLKNWQGKVELLVDEKIPSKVLEEHIRQAGIFYGLLYLRPAVNGPCGRFEVRNFRVEK